MLILVQNLINFDPPLKKFHNRTEAWQYASRKIYNGRDKIIIISHFWKNTSAVQLSPYLLHNSWMGYKLGSHFEPFMHYGWNFQKNTKIMRWFCFLKSAKIYLELVNCLVKYISNIYFLQFPTKQWLLKSYFTGCT